MPNPLMKQKIVASDESKPTLNCIDKLPKLWMCVYMQRKTSGIVREETQNLNCIEIFPNQRMFADAVNGKTADAKPVNAVYLLRERDRDRDGSLLRVKNQNHNCNEKFMKNFPPTFGWRKSVVRMKQNHNCSRILPNQQNMNRIWTCSFNGTLTEFGKLCGISFRASMHTEEKGNCLSFACLAKANKIEKSFQMGNLLF